MKRVLAVSDFHCGHHSGLTPPAFQLARGPFATFQRETWDWFSKEVDALRPIDCLFAVGDLIDGNGIKSGGVEQITTDRLEQAEMAIEIINFIRPKKVAFVYGTGYHTGNAEDFENVIVRQTRKIDGVERAEISGELPVDVDGVKFDLKHHIGSSGIPHGRFTAVARDVVWAALEALTKRRDRVDVVIRAHAHYWAYAENSLGIGVVLPGLQGPTKYGDRRCTGFVDYGFAHFDCEKGSIKSWGRHLLVPELFKRKTVKF